MMDGLVYSVGPTAISEAQLFGALNRIAEASGGRCDARAISAFHARLDSEALTRHQEAHGRLPRQLLERWDAFRADRRDSLGAGVSALPRELEFIRAQELQQTRRPLNARRIIPADRSVPLGFREHTWRRRVGRGEAVVTRGDTTNRGHAHSGRVEQKFPIIYIVCSVRQTYFEMLASDAAGLNQYGEDLKEARVIVDEMANRIYWNGHAPTGVWGAINHPSLMKKVLTCTIGGTSTSTGADIRQQMSELVDAPAIHSGEAMQPNVLALSPKIYRHVSETQHASGTDTSILKFWQQGQDENNGIKLVTKCQELEGIGPNGEDGLFAFRDEVTACGRVEVADTTSLPMYQSGALSWETVVFSAIGGTVMPNVGNNILGLAVAP